MRPVYRLTAAALLGLPLLLAGTGVSMACPSYEKPDNGKQQVNQFFFLINDGHDQEIANSTTLDDQN